MVGTLPGRTQGLGLITEPLLRDLQIDRVHFARINLWATLIGALFSIGVGRLIDRFGSRIVLTVVTVSLASVVFGMSATQQRRHDCDPDNSHAWIRSERALSGQHHDGWAVVCAPAQPCDGDIHNRVEHRLHAGISVDRRDRVVEWLANGVVDHRTRAAFGTCAACVITRAALA